MFSSDLGTKRDRETEGETHRDTERGGVTQREREKEGERDRDTQRERDTEREREGINGLFEKDDGVMFSFFCSERNASKLLSWCLWLSSVRVFCRPPAELLET